jgi:hypothetical protein
MIEAARRLTMAQPAPSVAPPPPPPRSLAPSCSSRQGRRGQDHDGRGLAVLDAETHGDGALVELGDGESGRRALAGARHEGVEHIVLQPEECLQRGATPLFGSATWRSSRSATSR